VEVGGGAEVEDTAAAAAAAGKEERLSRGVAAPEGSREDRRLPPLPPPEMSQLNSVMCPSELEMKSR